EIVTRPMGRIEFRDRIAGAPDGLVGLRIVGAGHPDRPAAGLPGIVLVLPGLAAGFARRRNGVFAPEELAGLGVTLGAPATSPVAARRRAHQDLVLERERRAGDAQRRIVLADFGLPHYLPGFLVGRDHACRLVGDRDDNVAPQRDAAVGFLPFLLGVHAP